MPTAAPNLAPTPTGGYSWTALAGAAGWSRRSVLRAGVALCGVVAVASACTEEPEPPDPLVAPAERARRDAELISAAIARFPDRADALTVMAAERRAHADALDAEVHRLTPTTAPDPTAAPGEMAQASSEPVAPPTLEEIRAGLIAAGDEAGAIARTQAGYRCGLLGSVAAACRTQVAIALP